MNLTLHPESGARSDNGSVPLNCSDPRALYFRLTVNCILAGPIILLGLIGNILSVIVWSRNFSRSSMSVLLSVLGVYDLVFLLLSIYKIFLIDGISRFATGINELLNAYSVARILLPTTWFLGNIARTGRNWIAVVVAIDRYVVVRNPFVASRQSNSTRAKLYSLSVTAMAIIYNIPRLWEFVPTVHNGKNVMIASENLGEMYNLIYSSILFSVCIIIGPIILLTVFNTLLTICLIKASHIRATLMRLNDQQSGNRETRMLIVVIAVFIATEFPGCVAQIILVKNFPKYCAFWDYFYTTVNFLAILNSSINFCIYCMCGRRFRQSMNRFLYGASDRSNNSDKNVTSSNVRKSTTNTQYARVFNNKSQFEEMIEMASNV